MGTPRRHGTEFTDDEFRSQYPRLAEELEKGVMQAPVTGVRSRESQKGDELRGPDAVGYLRRCRTIEEVDEVLAYLERKGEVTKDYAGKLREQAREQGLGSFGERKEAGYYFRKYWLEERSEEELRASRAAD